MFRKSWIVLGVVALCMALGVTAALAGSATFTGTLDPSDPTLPVVFIDTPFCDSQGIEPIHYEAHPFTVDTDGTYTITLTDTQNIVSMYVFEGSFDPANPFPTCAAGNNLSTPSWLTVGLTAGTQYFVVPIDDSEAQLGDSYSITIEGPGNINTVVADNCTYPLPTNSVLYNVPAGAPVFYDADLNTKVNFDLPAGTWKISEFSGDFAKVWIACEAQPIWIPSNAVGGAVS
jgi:hypothetical protein